MIVSFRAGTLKLGAKYTKRSVRQIDSALFVRPGEDNEQQPSSLLKEPSLPRLGFGACRGVSSGTSGERSASTAARSHGASDGNDYDEANITAAEDNNGCPTETGPRTRAKIKPKA
ncbi:hypothetical protein MTO96_000831 [Rhipicephalus appendiculatus]